ncbi:hypothetical protein ACHQM5_010007 [Ranunculus cassubicifolius]
MQLPDHVAISMFWASWKSSGKKLLKPIPSEPESVPPFDRRDVVQKCSAEDIENESQGDSTGTSETDEDDFIYDKPKDKAHYQDSATLADIGHEGLEVVKDGVDVLTIEEIMSDREVSVEELWPIARATTTDIPPRETRPAPVKGKSQSCGRRTLRGCCSVLLATGGGEPAPQEAIGAIQSYDGASALSSDPEWSSRFLFSVFCFLFS